MSFNPGANSISGARDTALSNPSDGQVFSYNASTEKWANATPEIAAINGLQPALNAKAATTHDHSVAQVTGLQSALDDKAAVDPVAGLSKVMVLGSGDPVPVGTPAGTVIIELSE